MVQFSTARHVVHFCCAVYMSIIDWIKGRKNITYDEAEGIQLITQYIKKYEGRRFYFKGLKKSYSDLSDGELLRMLQIEMDNMLVLYRYMVKVKQYKNRKGNSHCDIKIIGKAGMMSRYNMLDIELDIKTEKQEYLRNRSSDSH